VFVTVNAAMIGASFWWDRLELARRNGPETCWPGALAQLGLEVMPRPDFPFPGYWLGINGKIQVHMAQAGVPNSQLYYLGSPKNAANNDSSLLTGLSNTYRISASVMSHRDSIRKLAKPSR